jgi:hypothetical protein
MKISVLSIFIFSFVSCVYAQSKKINLDPTTFTIGTIDEYMGRYKDPIDAKITCYNLNENLLLFHTYNLFKQEFPDLVIDSTTNEARCLTSKKLTEKINQFYSWKYDPDVTNENRDSLFIGKLNLKKFNDDSQKISYLIGVYQRYGKRMKNSYSITLINSRDKYEFTLSILKNMGCTITKSKIYEGVPGTEIIEFKPTENLELYLNQLNNG